MKKIISTGILRTSLFLVLLFCVGTIAKAQLLAHYTLRSSGGNPTPGKPYPGTVAPCVNAGDMIQGNLLSGSGNSTGFRLKYAGPDDYWPGIPTDGYHLDFPFSPTAGNDFNISSITFRDTLPENSPNLMVYATFRVDGVGPWHKLANPVNLTGNSFADFNLATNETFYNGHTYIIRFYIYGNGTAIDKNAAKRIEWLKFNGTCSSTPAQPVSVTTLTATATGKYTADATGSYSYNGTQYYLVKQSGFIWSTNAAALTTLDTSATTKTTNGSAGNINSTLTGLSAGTTYFIKSYIVTQFGIQYGNVKSFTTAVPSLPTVTLTLSNILANKITASGSIPDSGGVDIIEKGFVFSKNSNPLIGSQGTTVVKDGVGSANFSEIIKGLAASTNYCFKAYAKNSVGVAYSAEDCKTTPVQGPVLTAIPGSIDFGPNFYGSSPITVSYILTGTALTPASGNITITAPAPFKISLSAGTGFTNTLTLPYTNSKLTATPIYVQLPTTAYGSWGYASILNVTHTGGGVSVADADVVQVSGSIQQAPEEISNKGTDFWLGFGYHNRMKSGTSDAVTKSKLTVYVSTGNNPAKVVVEIPGMPGGGYPQTITIPANSTQPFINFPDGVTAGIDARLFTTGVFPKGIHVYSTDGTPVSVWAYISTTNDAAAGSMIFPSNTWNSNYTVQAYGGPSNNGLPNSYFFVIANEDNTVVTINPSAGIIAPNQAFIDNPTVGYPAGVPFTITLNKGEVFNAIGVITGTGNNATSAGYDLSGTSVSTTCDKKIAVFGGNGRALVTTPSTCTNPGSGSDNMIQQMVPSVAWDTKYFTVPTKHMENNLFRIYVKENTQQVWINDETHSTTAKLLNTAGVKTGSNFNGFYTFVSFVNGGGYYALETNQPIEIESDLPISVSQFITAGACAEKPAIGNNGKGDPEMIILTGAQQAITDGRVYSPPFQNGNPGGHYINVVIPKEGINTFKLDNSATVDTGRSSFSGAAGMLYGNSGPIPIANAFKPYSANSNYYWAKFKVTGSTAHTMSSSVPFNAIAYGVADGESYGFNAGTLIKNLQSIKFTDNPNGGDTSSTVVRTCKDNPVTLKIALPYLTSLVDSIIWNPAGDPRITPNTKIKGAMNGAIAKSEGSITGSDGRTFNIYSSPVKYEFGDLGVYNFEVIAYGKFKSDCPGEDRQNIIVVVGRDNAYFEPVAACGSPIVSFNDFTTAMAGTNITKSIFDYGDGSPLITTTTPGTPASHTYNLANGTYYKVKLTTQNSVGCNSYYETEVDFGGGLKAEFTKSPTTAICQNGSYTFTDNTTYSGTSGLPNKYEWDFGDGTAKVTQPSVTPQTHSFANAGKYGVKLTVTTNQGCIDTYIDSVVVEATPVAKFDATSACLGSPTVFTDQSTISIGTIDARTWDFGDGTPPVNDNTNTISHTYANAGTYTAKLKVQSSGGCPSIEFTKDVIVNPSPKDSFDIDVNCTTKEVMFTDKSVTNGGTIATYNWTIDGIPATQGSVNTFKQTFNDANEHVVTLRITTSNGCNNTIGFTRKFTISASPVADFDIPAKVCLPNDAAIFTNTTTISDGTGAQISYAWDFGDNTTQNQAAPAPMTISHPYASATTYTVKLTATSSAGCTNTKTKTINTILPQPKANFTLPTPAEVCINAKAALSATGTSGAEWYWNFGTGFGAVSKKDTVGVWNVSADTVIKHYYVSTQGCISDTISKTIKVNPLPKNGFDKIIDCSLKLVTFTDTSSAGVGTIVKRHWVFGDGTRDDNNLATVPHTYTGSGPFTATLWVESSKGCQDSTNRASITFTISATPASSFTLPTTNICLPAGTAVFKNTSTLNALIPADGTTADFINSWDFGDNSGFDTSYGLADMTHTYTGVGPYTVKLITTSKAGCNNTATPQVLNTIFAQPKATFTAAAEACLNSTASFASTGTAAGSTTAQWYWDLGIGSFGTLSKKDTVAAFAASGDKIIRHYLVSAAGCTSDTATKTVTVNALPTAAFTQAAVGCAGKTVTFVDGSATTTTGASIVEWNWFYGDGTSEKLTTAGATHTYAIGGSYFAKLVVKDSKGCYSDTGRLTIEVNPNPVPLFTVTDICLPSVHATFTDASTITSGSITDWRWTLGDNTDTLHLASFTHVYTTGGVYPVTLTATSDKGCITTGTPVDVTAVSAPIAKDSILNAGNLCSSNAVTLINESVPDGFGVVSKVEIFWDHAGDQTVKTVDNNPPTLGQYSHKYAELATDKNYDVLIRAYSNNGCFRDSVRTISVLASPLLNFAALSNICEEKDTIQLATPSDAYNLPIRTAFFSGDGITDSIGHFFPALAGPGNHIITYTDTAANGCVSIATQPIFVYATPIIKMASSRSVLLGDNITLNPTVTGNIQTYTWTPGTYLNNASILNPISTPLEDITYKLKVVSKDACEADSSVNILVLQDFKVPNTFTPNNDQINDYWIIEQLPRFPIQRVQVFNRYGQIVYETKKYDPRGWNGNYKGSPLPIGTYYYIIELDGMVEPKVGYVTIIK